MKGEIWVFFTSVERTEAHLTGIRNYLSPKTDTINNPGPVWVPITGLAFDRYIRSLGNTESSRWINVSASSTAVAYSTAISSILEWLFTKLNK